MEDLDLRISYCKVLEIEAAMANSVIEQTMLSGGGCYLPHWLVKDKFVWCTLDNIDLFHATALAVYQSSFSDCAPITTNVKLDRISNVRTLKETPGWQLLHCKKPELTKIKMSYSMSFRKKSSKEYRQKNIAWLIGSSIISTLEERKLPGT